MVKSCVKQLRQHLTEAEQRLWFYLRDRRFMEKKFRRQHPVGPYVADFYCAECRLVIELDGGQHSWQETKDTERSRFIETKGLIVLRVWNNEVMENIEGVLAKVRACF